jgi:vacuolar-type H+-ATPase subunit H
MKGILDLLDELEDILEQGSSMPFTGKVMVNKEEMLEVITDIRLKLPGEVKQSKWVVEERNKIIVDAQKEADAIVKNSGTIVNKLVDEHEITKLAKEAAEKIVAEARYTAKEMRLGALEYADEVLGLMENMMRDSMEATNKQAEDMLGIVDNVMRMSKESVVKQAEKSQQVFNENLEVIYQNRQKLRGK